MATHHVEIFYLDARNGWALAHFDAEGNQLGEAETAFHRRELTDFARGHLDSTPVEVYGANGRLLYTING